MATKVLMKPQIKVSQLSPPLPNTIEVMIRSNFISSPRNFHKISRFVQQRTILCAEQQQNNVEVSQSQIKIHLYDALQALSSKPLAEVSGCFAKFPATTFRFPLSYS